MTIEYTLDFTSVLPQKLTPRLNEVQTLLNCEVKDIGRGNIIIQIRPGIFVLRVHDDAKGKSLENRKVTYFLPGDIEGKKPKTVFLKKREERKKWVNPKYVTIWGVHKEDLADVLTNKVLTKYFSDKYGTILEPVEDVTDLSEESWALDKKKCRIDLDKDKHIPRECPIEIKTEDGDVKRGSLRVTYKDQPWFCRKCQDYHVADCPKWLENRRREEEIKEQKAKETKTLILGDSNLKLINSHALLADVVSSSGAKIGHVTNELSFENAEKYKNIVLFAGINNIPGPNERVDEQKVTKQIETEMKTLETEAAKHMKKGRNIFFTEVSNSQHCRSNPRAIKRRNNINKGLVDMKIRLKTQHKNAKTDVINWSPFLDENDYSTVKAISNKAIIEFLSKVEEKIDGSLRANYLDRTLTAEPYTKVTPTYPMGCRKCTAIGHAESSCPADHSKKRNRSEEAEPQGPMPKITSIDEVH